MSNRPHLAETTFANNPVEITERVKSPLNEKLNELGFHGSYRPEDVTFLMQIDDIAPTDVKEKEYLIQSGKMHYSQMISVENPPSTAQMQHFQYAFEQGSQRLAFEPRRFTTLGQNFGQERLARPRLAPRIWWAGLEFDSKAFV